MQHFCRSHDLTGLQIKVRNWNFLFLFFNQNMCCGYTKNPIPYIDGIENNKRNYAKCFVYQDPWIINTICGLSDNPQIVSIMTIEEDECVIYTYLSSQSDYFDTIYETVAGTRIILNLVCLYLSSGRVLGENVT